MSLWNYTRVRVVGFTFKLKVWVFFFFIYFFSFLYLHDTGGIWQSAETMGSFIEVLREQMTFLLEQGLYDSAEMLVCISICLCAV